VGGSSSIRAITSNPSTRLKHRWPSLHRNNQASLPSHFGVFFGSITWSFIVVVDATSAAREQTLWRKKGLVIEGTCNQRSGGLETSFLLLRHCFFAPSKHHHLCSSLASYSKTLSNCTSSAKALSSFLHLIFDQG